MKRYFLFLLLWPLNLSYPVKREHNNPLQADEAYSFRDVENQGFREDQVPVLAVVVEGVTDGERGERSVKRCAPLSRLGRQTNPYNVLHQIYPYGAPPVFFPNGHPFVFSSTGPVVYDSVKQLVKDRLRMAPAASPASPYFPQIFRQAEPSFDAPIARSLSPPSQVSHNLNQYSPGASGVHWPLNQNVPFTHFGLPKQPFNIAEPRFVDSAGNQDQQIFQPRTHPTMEQLLVNENIRLNNMKDKHELERYPSSKRYSQQMPNPGLTQENKSLPESSWSPGALPRRFLRTMNSETTSEENQNRHIHLKGESVFNESDKILVESDDKKTNAEEHSPLQEDTGISDSNREPFILCSLVPPGFSYDSFEFVSGQFTNNHRNSARDILMNPFVKHSEISTDFLDRQYLNDGKKPKPQFVKASSLLGKFNIDDSSQGKYKCFFLKNENEVNTFMNNLYDAMESNLKTISWLKNKNQHEIDSNSSTFEFVNGMFIPVKESAAKYGHLNNSFDTDLENRMEEVTLKVKNDQYLPDIPAKNISHHLLNLFKQQYEPSRRGRDDSVSEADLTSYRLSESHDLSSGGPKGSKKDSIKAHYLMVDPSSYRQQPKISLVPVIGSENEKGKYTWNQQQTYEQNKNINFSVSPHSIKESELIVVSPDYIKLFHPSDASTPEVSATRDNTKTKTYFLVKVPKFDESDRKNEVETDSNPNFGIIKKSSLLQPLTDIDNMEESIGSVVKKEIFSNETNSENIPSNNYKVKIEQLQGNKLENDESGVRPQIMLIRNNNFLNDRYPFQKLNSSTGNIHILKKDINSPRNQAIVKGQATRIVLSDDPLFNAYKIPASDSSLEVSMRPPIRIGDLTSLENETESNSESTTLNGLQEFSSYDKTEKNSNFHDIESSKQNYRTKLCLTNNATPLSKEDLPKAKFIMILNNQKFPLQLEKNLSPYKMYNEEELVSHFNLNVTEKGERETRLLEAFKALESLRGETRSEVVAALMKSKGDNGGAVGAQDEHADDGMDGGSRSVREAWRYEHGHGTPRDPHIYPCTRNFINRGVSIASDLIKAIKHVYDDP